MALTVQIQKRYGSFLLDVDFTAENRQVLALLGASGCGKSATLKCVAGTEKPDRGRITLDGRVLFDSTSRINLPPQNRLMGFLFQNYALFPHMTVEGNVAVCLNRMETSRRRARVRKLLSLLRLEGLESLYGSDRRESGGDLAGEPGAGQRGSRRDSDRGCHGDAGRTGGFRFWRHLTRN